MAGYVHVDAWFAQVDGRHNRYFRLDVQCSQSLKFQVPWQSVLCRMWKMRLGTQEATPCSTSQSLLVIYWSSVE
ncbi:uncharacterized protein PHALS_15359 [Plasmopara halstedii]|uniref:Uncharacterized protein n=1 Tax=Plasmopara halstedii TaxID=4781 RepID=A0A0N7L4N0_PLAHL|nr:uncharacterized protein PHALS_15359 [Plasmopara halstedii]CEG39131.1 hypothetical protein PHALS_15359 [Plasmopara halstedii]|eukprot:XP_024575500.1 hypothetical protein PHALS_15359 [Plasmopara halstedii]